ncbi:TonB-dependent receptor [Nisaea acidiphila]|uniref:TonB-dependent receptor n=1 Tax=Nisaea acidiphila TaxID=1862145 RepID=A0A9J7AV39_9PROT|nr:TonB-dependent receptor [Nisaea acidiphila]UUX49277.1 TonB-dependent receptor [Nisaea acidiphila]
MKTRSMVRLLCSLSLIPFVCASPAGAQQATEKPEQAVTLPPIVVTGENVERSLEDTASSVVVFSEEELSDRSQAATVADVLKSVPNLIYTDTVGAPIIRGQDTQGPNFGSTAFFGGTIPRATINLDGHYLNYYEYVFGATSIWDTEAIEVFRGPQTTSQGANAIAGAIIVKTKDPSFAPEGAYQAEYGSYNRKRASVAVSGPLVEDQLAARLAVDYFGRDTFIDYTNPSFSKGKTDQDLESFNLRSKVLLLPEDLPGLSAKLTYARIYNNRPTYETASEPYDDLNNATTSMPSWEQNTNTGILDVDYDFENGFKVFNQSQYSDMHVDRVTEPVTNGSAEVDQQNMSNETKLTWGGAKDMFSGVAGLYLARTTSDDILFIRGTSEFDDEKQHLGLYSDMTYRLTDRWTLTGGLRFQRDSIERSGSSSFATGTLDYDESFDAFLPRASLAYAVTPTSTVGAMVSRGYNPGGVNLSFATGEYITFEEETVWNYELFGRTRLLDGRLGISGNLFYSDYKDSQRLLPDYLNGLQYGSVVVNAESAESYGLELAVDYLVRDDLRLRAGAGLLQSEIGSFSSVDGTDYTGNEFGRAPGYMFNFGADWDITSEIRLSGDVRHTDGYYSTDENDPSYEVDNYTVADMRLSYAPREFLQFYAFANNIFDERAESYLYDDRSVGGIVANMIEPRVVGIGVKGTF